MMNTADDIFLSAVRAALLAGEAILEVYHRDDREITYKDDHSPLTLADRRADTLIRKTLSPTGLPILSEESRSIPYEQRRKWKRFWLVDPLDGTKEFIKKNDEFTVNIALIEGNEAVAGVVYLPVFRQLYFARRGQGAYRLDGVDATTLPAPGTPFPPEGAVRLPLPRHEGVLRVVVSRSHLSPETEAYIRRVLGEETPYETVAAGSSLKLCRVAEGVADLYPRLGPTMEWDIAAAVPLVTESGSTITQTDGSPVRFNKEDLHNPWFVVAAPTLKEKILNTNP